MKLAGLLHNKITVWLRNPKPSLPAHHRKWRNGATPSNATPRLYFGITHCLGYEIKKWLSEKKSTIVSIFERLKNSENQFVISLKTICWKIDVYSYALFKFLFKNSISDLCVWMFTLPTNTIPTSTRHSKLKFYLIYFSLIFPFSIQPEWMFPRPSFVNTSFIIWNSLPSHVICGLRSAIWNAFALSFRLFFGSSPDGDKVL